MFFVVIHTIFRDVCFPSNMSEMGFWAKKHNKNSISYPLSLELEQPQPLLDNDYILPKVLFEQYNWQLTTDKNKEKMDRGNNNYNNCTKVSQLAVEKSETNQSITLFALLKICACNEPFLFNCKDTSNRVWCILNWLFLAIYYLN